MKTSERPDPCVQTLSFSSTGSTETMWRLNFSSASVKPAAKRGGWSIIAYIRALQLSQRATLEDVPAEEREKLVGSR